ncbi:MAG TPA: molybdopterin oxidoreductase family protein [Candidatus Limnocylindria bacterium]|jgi:assimilatory nitrate reductase catalytic subunit|nr:molybdopterin oxidoreductase family protein [Candidatus Limnocylindria bacterium]
MPLPGDHPPSESKENSLLRRWTGPLTTDLVQNPGKFGLGRIPERLVPNATTTVVCGFCSTGCGLNVHLRDGEAINLSADTTYPVNLGMACPKGWEALTPLSAPDRATAPLLRDPVAGTETPISWRLAMETFVSRMKAIQQRHGPTSIAFLSTGQMCVEEMALLGGLFKFGMGGLHCDSNTRQCMATSHVAYKESFGFDAPPFTYADFETSDTLVFIGANPCIAHPIMWQRVLRNPNQPQIIVIDPRRTETAMNASLHLPIAPKSDLVFLYGTAQALIERGHVAHEFVRAHTTGFDAFAQFIKPFTRERVLSESGLDGDTFDHWIDLLVRGQRVSLWWTMGVNQGHESTRTAQAIINLALMTGNIGRPGTGANSITGQCNAMGSRLFANVTSLFAGRDFKRETDRAEVAGILDIPTSTIPSRDSWAYDQIVDGIDKGEIRGLWLIATNSAHSWVHQERLQGLFKKLDFLVVQDLYHSIDSARDAHLILPAAGWAEKDGTLVNSERRFGLVKKVRRAPGQALSDFAIFKLVAEAWGCGSLFERWSSPEATFQILKSLSQGRPCDITGIRDYRHLDDSGGIQWPFPEGAPTQADGSPETERRLFGDGRFYTPDGRARFVYENPRPLPEPTCAEYPFVLMTGRGSSAQWHTNTRTGKSDVLRKLYPEHAYVEIHPDDAKALGVGPGEKVEISSRRGSLVVNALITPTVQPRQLFLPMHYDGVNKLTHSSFDAYSRQPNYKHCAVKIRRA